MTIREKDRKISVYKEERDRILENLKMVSNLIQGEIREEEEKYRRRYHNEYGDIVKYKHLYVTSHH